MWRCRHVQRPLLVIVTRPSRQSCAMISMSMSVILLPLCWAYWITELQTYSPMTVEMEPIALQLAANETGEWNQCRTLPPSKSCASSSSIHVKQSEASTHLALGRHMIEQHNNNGLRILHINVLVIHMIQHFPASYWRKHKKYPTVGALTSLHRSVIDDCA